jgi:opacity protein-like surface antigen
MGRVNVRFAQEIPTMFARAFRSALAVAALLVAVSATSQAQEATKGFGLTGGIALPMGDFGEGSDLGFHFGGQYQMPLSGKLGLRFNADWGRYGIKDIDGNTTMLGGVVNLTYDINTGTGLMPYVFGGLGYYNTKVEVGGFSADASDLAFNVGAGYNFKMGNANLFTEIRYLSIQGDGGSLNTLPIVVGIRF